MREVIRHLRRAALLHKGDGPSDGQLLESFVSRREETAFEALLRRHGPMVLGVCQRILRNVHDAEDAFQATFLVLSRRASSVTPRDMVGSWLYGVAYRTAMKARAMNAKRRMKESRAGEMPHSKPSPDEERIEQLDHELSRLPDKYRVPLVLCELEGSSRKDVARLLGIPEGTLSWRLAQAKKLLAKRLSRHELTISLGALAVGLSPTLRASTLKTALTAGTLPAQVLALAEGVLKAMLLSKLKMTMCAAALMVLAGVGATGLTYRATAQEPKQVERVEYRKVFVTGADSRSATDDLDALRLEIESLRKELRATKERVKALEEANAQIRRNDTRSRAGESPQQPKTPQAANKNYRLQTDYRLQNGYLLRNQLLLTDKPFGVEEALKKLLANPENKQAKEALEQAVKQQVTETLEQALKQMKEREKPRDAGPKESKP